jgi:hypothetical protein
MDPTPVTRLAVAGPLDVGDTPRIATPNGVPGTGTTATGTGSTDAGRAGGAGGGGGGGVYRGPPALSAGPCPYEGP